MSLMMVEWDTFALSHAHLQLPLFRDRFCLDSYALFQDCVQVLDLSRLVDAH